MEKMCEDREGFPDLKKHLKNGGRKFVTYSEAARIYGIPYYSFVRLAREAGANYTLRKTAIADLEEVEKYLDENPDAQIRVEQVRRDK